MLQESEEICLHQACWRRQGMKDGRVNGRRRQGGIRQGGKSEGGKEEYKW